MEKYNDTPWIPRDIEKDFQYLASFNIKRKAFWVSGLNKVGKTTLLTKFGKESFRKFHVLDLTDKEQRVRAERAFSKALSVIGGTAYDKRYASAALKNCIEGFDDSPDEFLLIDEIQESEHLYNLARWIVRGLDAKVCFVGSFLGDTVNWERVNIPAGDVMCLDVLPVTYGEFVRSIDDLEKYRAVRDFTGTNPDPVLYDPKPYWDTFYELGGFPQPLAASLTGDKAKALKMQDLELNDFVESVQEKTQGNMPLNIWKNLLGYTILAILCHKDPTDLDNLKLIKEPAEYPATTFLEMVHKLMSWMKGSSILTCVPVIDRLDVLKPFLISKCEFTNYWVLSKLVEVSGNLDLKCADVKTDTFVLNELRHLNSLCPNISLCNYVLDGKHVGFLFFTKAGARVLVEAEKPGIETLVNWDMAVERPDFFIRLTKGTGFAQGCRIEIPIWHMDRLPIIMGLIDIAYTNDMTLEKAYKRYTNGIEDKVIKKPDSDDCWTFDGDASYGL
ncbi:MAG: AAA family ATPase [Clostridiales bacterium]|jgi:hypothetical protein|nr:AAA family ATPase [Clostridiales bacterium]